MKKLCLAKVIYFIQQVDPQLSTKPIYFEKKTLNLVRKHKILYKNKQRSLLINKRSFRFGKYFFE